MVGGRGQGVPTLPVRAIQRPQSRRIDKHLIKDERLGRQAIEGRSFNPCIAVGTQESVVQTIDDKTDCVHKR
jgi:hypothetical protein